MRAINKHSANPKIWSVEMPNAPYLNRCQQLKLKEKKDESTIHIIHLTTVDFLSN